MPAPRDAATVERTRVLVETTTLPLDPIAAEVGVTVRTVRNWMAKYKWQRPPGAPGRVLKITPEKEGPAQRVFENRATVTDLAILLGCDTSYIYHYARPRGWVHHTAAAAVEVPHPKDEEIAAVVAALREPTIERREAIRLMERAIALTAADALASGEARAGRRVDMLGKLAGLIKGLPEDVAAPPRRDADAADHFPDANDLIEEIARRFEAFSEEWIDPRVLAAVAATVP